MYFYINFGGKRTTPVQTDNEEKVTYEKYLPQNCEITYGR